MTGETPAWKRRALGLHIPDEDIVCLHGNMKIKWPLEMVSLPFPVYCYSTQLKQEQRVSHTLASFRQDCSRNGC